MWRPSSQQPSKRASRGTHPNRRRESDHHGKSGPWGPWQDSWPYDPGRIIMTGEKAYIAVGVWMNTAMLANVVGFGAHIESLLLHLQHANHEASSCAGSSVLHLSRSGLRTSTYAFGTLHAHRGSLPPTRRTSVLVSATATARLVPDYAGFVRWVWTSTLTTCSRPAGLAIRSSNPLHGGRPWSKC